MLAACGDENARDGLALNPACDQGLRGEIVRSSDTVTHFAIALSLLGPDDLMEFACSESPVERLGAASNSGCPPEVLERLADDDAPEVRKRGR